MRLSAGAAASVAAKVVSFPEFVRTYQNKTAVIITGHKTHAIHN
jgi:hypothetical protein